MRFRSSVRVLALGAVLLAAAPAVASPEFPAAIQDHLGLSYEPPCSVCHKGGVTGSGTVTTPFGQSMRAEGLVEGDEASLTASLDALAAKDVDSDGDSVLDIDELVSGNDPNRPDKGEAPSLSAGTPAYGCGARIAPSAGADDPHAALALSAVLAMLALLGRRRCRGRGGPAISQCT